MSDMTKAVAMQEVIRNNPGRRVEAVFKYKKAYLVIAPLSEDDDADDISDEDCMFIVSNSGCLPFTPAIDLDLYQNFMRNPV